MPDSERGPRNVWAPATPQFLHQVLLLTNPQRYVESARALLAAIVEAERFFVTGGVNLHTTCTVVANSDKASLELPGVVLESTPPFQELIDALQNRTKGTFRRTTDQNVLARALRELLGIPPERHLQIVVDLEIMPPPEWRYIIWDGVDNGTVVAIPPTDPEYWQVRDEHRVNTVKHRIRTACISSIGEWLGLTRCDKLNCLMYADVDAAVRLDSMTRLGAEHPEWAAMKGRGYDPRAENPFEIQPIAQMAPVGGGAGGSMRIRNGRFDPRVYLKAPEPDLEDL